MIKKVLKIKKALFLLVLVFLFLSSYAYAFSLSDFFKNFFAVTDPSKCTTQECRTCVSNTFCKQYEGKGYSAPQEYANGVCSLRPKNYWTLCSNSCSNGKCSGSGGDDCSDSDSENYYNKGYVTVEGDSGSPYYDYCSGSNLKEMVCEDEGYWAGKVVKVISYYCDNGCSNGACRKEPSIECTDSDGGDVINIKGTVKDKNKNTRTDFCQDSNTVQEYICENDDSYSAVVRDCASGKVCSDGKCEGVNQCTDLDTGKLRDIGYKYCRWNYPQTEYSYECMSNGEWKSEACPADCNDINGNCYDRECHPGLYANERCKDSDTKIYDKCLTDGHWKIDMEENCLSGQTCIDGQCLGKVICNNTGKCNPEEEHHLCYSEPKGNGKYCEDLDGDGCFEWGNERPLIECGGEPNECKADETKCEGRMVYGCIYNVVEFRWVWHNPNPLPIIGRCGAECINDFDCDSDTEYCSKVDYVCMKKEFQCETLVKKGDSNKKIDLTFVGNGYNNLEHFKADLNKQLYFDKEISFFSIEPFASSLEKFNIWYVPKLYDVLPIKDGFSPHVSGDFFRETKDICKATDFMVMITPYNFRSFAYRGNYAFVSESYNGEEFVSLVLTHELGHVIGWLDDEYVENLRISEKNCKKNKYDFGSILTNYETFDGCGSEQYFRSSNNSLMRYCEGTNGDKFNEISIYYLNEKLMQYE